MNWSRNWCSFHFVVGCVLPAEIVSCDLLLHRFCCPRCVVPGTPWRWTASTTWRSASTRLGRMDARFTVFRWRCPNSSGLRLDLWARDFSHLASVPLAALVSNWWAPDRRRWCWTLGLRWRSRRWTEWGPFSHLASRRFRWSGPLSYCLGPRARANCMRSLLSCRGRGVVMPIVAPLAPVVIGLASSTVCRLIAPCIPVIVSAPLLYRPLLRLFPVLLGLVVVAAMPLLLILPTPVSLPLPPIALASAPVTVPAT